jgi:hypothetical protein
MDFRIEPLSKEHIKNDFQSHHESLQRYIREIAKQDVKRNLSACYVLVQGSKVVKGYYTLSSTSIPNEQIPDEYKNKIGIGYKTLPATLIGRLAVDEKERGKGLWRKVSDGCLGPFVSFKCSHCILCSCH